MKRKKTKTHKHGLSCLWGHLIDLKNWVAKKIHWSLNSGHLVSLVAIGLGGALIFKCLDPWLLVGSLGVLWGARRLLIGCCNK